MQHFTLLVSCCISDRKQQDPQDFQPRQIMQGEWVLQSDPCGLLHVCCCCPCAVPHCQQQSVQLPPSAPCCQCFLSPAHPRHGVHVHSSNAISDLSFQQYRAFNPSGLYRYKYSQHPASKLWALTHMIAQEGQSRTTWTQHTFSSVLLKTNMNPGHDAGTVCTCY